MLSTLSSVLVFRLSQLAMAGLAGTHGCQHDVVRSAAKVDRVPMSGGSSRVVLAARGQLGVTVTYDPAYRSLRYPMGDIPVTTGVCADVVVRAFRGAGIDLQREVHVDMSRAFEHYPRLWSLKAPDANIDHRRVANLMTWFSRKGYSQPITARGADYLPGDVIAWRLEGGRLHTGVVSDEVTSDGRPMIIHNIGAGAQLEDVLFAFRIVGHYRVFSSRT